MIIGVKVLVVDDQPEFRDTLSFWLRTKGYEVTEASCGADGIMALKKGEFDIVFLDFKMPGMDGLETIMKIREFNKTVPIVVITAYADSVIVRGIKRYNISGFFSKLEKLDKLQQSLDVVLRGLRRTKSSVGGPS